MPSASELDAVTVDAFRTLVGLADPGPCPRRRARAARARARRSDDPARVRDGGRLLHSASSRGPRRRVAPRASHRAPASSSRPRTCPSRHPTSSRTSSARSSSKSSPAQSRRSRAFARPGSRSPAWRTGMSLPRRASSGRRWGGTSTSSSAPPRPARKPDPRIFLLTLERLGVNPGRALHVGDDEVDRDGAVAAGLAFEPVPLSTVPARLGLGTSSL